MNPIRNIIFDLGGVVINLRRENAVDALKSLGISDADKLLGLYRQEEPFLGLETGRITAAEFFDLMRKCAKNQTISDVQFQNAFNSFLVSLPLERLRALQALRNAGYRVFMLSNTNPVMYHSWIQEHFRADGASVNDYFDGIVTSFQEGCCKPDPQVFINLLRRYGLNPAETMMADDSDANCRAAQTLGMHAVRIDNSQGPTMLDLCNLLLQAAGCPTL